jgi:hypothetical protein
MAKFKVTLNALDADGESTPTIEGCDMQINGGVLMIRDENGNMVATFADKAWRGCVKVPEPKK